MHTTSSSSRRHAPEDGVPCNGCVVWLCGLPCTAAAADVREFLQVGRQQQLNWWLPADLASAPRLSMLMLLLLPLLLLGAIAFAAVIKLLLPPQLWCVQLAHGVPVPCDLIMYCLLPAVWLHQWKTGSLPFWQESSLLRAAFTTFAYSASLCE